MPKDFHMMPPAYTVALLFFVSFGIIAIAGLAYVFSRTPMTRFALVVTLLVVYAVLALAPLVFLRPLLLVLWSGGVQLNKPPKSFIAFRKSA